MKRFVLAFLLSAIAVSSNVSAQPQKEELLSSPRFLENTHKVVFKKIGGDTVRDSIKIVSGRSSAILEFNTPLVTVTLPAMNNSAYAIVMFEKPVVLNERNTPIPFELERGGYDGGAFSTEIRLLNKADSRPLVFSQVRGSGTIRYPLEIRTLEFDKRQNRLKQGKIELDGPFVTYIDNNIEEMFFLNTDIGPVRGFDSKGRRLESYPFKASRTEGDETKRTLAFWGEIAKVEIDTVNNWVELEFDYDLLPSKPLPERFSGVPRSQLPKGMGTATGKGSVRVVPKPQHPAPKQVPSHASQMGKDPAKSIPLYVAVSIFPEVQVLKLIASGTDINQQNEAGWTALHTAAYRCDLTRTVQALVDAGADINLKTGNGQTALWLAREMKCAEIQRILERAGTR
ncbi:MAG: hypothetical protein A2V65_07690 [Deltaproteobacteria bacterium RBG_13_49_15]|nr:MAG: hypothetical protein A2V65_07690 [Deltaproteobacteria bacterium RBG_13_49_15]